MGFIFELNNYIIFNFRFKGPEEELRFFTAKIANTEACYEVAMQHEFIDIAAEVNNYIFFQLFFIELNIDITGASKTEGQGSSA